MSSFGERVMRFLMRLHGFRPPPEARLKVELSPEAQEHVRALSQLNGRSPEKVVNELIIFGVPELLQDIDLTQRWRALSRREQEVAAQICLADSLGDCTDSIMARRMMISRETVKTHARNMLRKMRVSSRRELRELLSRWDFGEFEDIDFRY